MTAVDDIDAAPTLLGDAPFAGLQPGAALAVAVDGVDPADSSDDALLDLVLAFQRLVPGPQRAPRQRRPSSLTGRS